jgi:hypothetical protein
MEAVPSSETLVDFYRTTGCNISDDSTLHSHRRAMRPLISHVYPCVCVIHLLIDLYGILLRDLH